MSTSILGIVNTRLWLQPWSDPCLKSTESTGDGSADRQLWGESTGGLALDKSLVCLVSLIPSLFIWSCPFFYIISDPRLNTTDYFWSQVFQVNIISALQHKAHALIPAVHLNHPPFESLSALRSPHCVIFILSSASPPTPLINVFDANAHCSNTGSGECLRCN